VGISLGALTYRSTADSEEEASATHEGRRDGRVMGRKASKLARSPAPPRLRLPQGMYAEQEHEGGGATGEGEGDEERAGSAGRISTRVAKAPEAPMARMPCGHKVLAPWPCITLACTHSPPLPPRLARA
jgi:hypothetical protein